MAKESTNVSARIRERVKASGRRFHANDNISEFIEQGELDGLTKEVCEKMTAVLESLVIDVEHDHNTRETARRVAKMYVNEVFRGRYVPLPKVTEFPNAEHLNELMIMGPVTVRSAYLPSMPVALGACVLPLLLSVPLPPTWQLAQLRSNSTLPRVAAVVS